jgi:hypothetical protein
MYGQVEMPPPPKKKTYTMKKLPWWTLHLWIVINPRHEQESNTIFKVSPKSYLEMLTGWNPGKESTMPHGRHELGKQGEGEGGTLVRELKGDRKFKY